MSPGTLTPKQKRVLDFIREFSAGRGYAPSQQEIAARFGFQSLGTVQNYLVRLEREGFLDRSWNGKRALKVVEAEPRGQELPLLGRVAAGRPIDAVEDNETLEVPSWMVGRGETFVLRARGDSMVGDGILDGDYLVVRRQQTAENGDTVIALVDGGATVKRFHRAGRGVELRPANPAMNPIVVEDGGDLQLEGVVIGVLRSFR